MFIGPTGIRAGWRFLMFAVLVVLLRLALFRIPPVWRLLKTADSGTLTPFVDGTAASISAITAFVAAFVMSRIEKQSVSSYGAPLKGAVGRLFMIGAFWGLGLLSLEILIIHVMGGFNFGGLALRGGGRCFNMQ